MAYSTDNPPLLVQNQPIAAQRSWFYSSTHTRAVAVASTHITNGKALGMKVGDQVFIGETTASGANASTDVSLISYHPVREVGSTYVILGVGMLISSAS